MLKCIEMDPKSTQDPPRNHPESIQNSPEIRAGHWGAKNTEMHPESTQNLYRIHPETTQNPPEIWVGHWGMQMH